MPGGGYPADGSFGADGQYAPDDRYRAATGYGFPPGPVAGYGPVRRDVPGYPGAPGYGVGPGRPGTGIPDRSGSGYPGRDDYRGADGYPSAAGYRGQDGYRGQNGYPASAGYQSGPPDRYPHQDRYPGQPPAGHQDPAFRSGADYQPRADYPADRTEWRAGPAGRESRTWRAAPGDHDEYVEGRPVWAPGGRPHGYRPDGADRSDRYWQAEPGDYRAPAPAPYRQGRPVPVDDYLVASPLPPDAPRYWDRYDEPIRPPAYRDRVGPDRLPNGPDDGSADGVVGPVSGDRREPAGRLAEPRALTAGAADVTERRGGPRPGAQAGPPAGTTVAPADATTAGAASQEDDAVTAPIPVVGPGVTGAKPDPAVSAAGPAGGFAAAQSGPVVGAPEPPGPAGGVAAEQPAPAVSSADPVPGPADPVAESAGPASAVHAAAGGRAEGRDGESARGPFEPLRGNGSAASADQPGSAGDPDYVGSQPSPDSVGDGPESGPSQSDQEGADAAAAKLDQIKDLYLTAEAIGDDALAKHFQQVSERQRQLIREYFDEAIGRDAEDRASG